MSSKRKRLSLKDKIEVIIESEKSGLSARKLAENLGIGKTQVSAIIKNKEELLKLYEEGASESQKRKFPNTKGQAVDQVVFNWFSEAMCNNMPISGPIIKQKALEVAQKLEFANFKASNGWLGRFCQRHSISLKSLTGDSTEGEIGKKKLSATLNSPKDVCNVNATVLKEFDIVDKETTNKNQEDLIIKYINEVNYNDSDCDSESGCGNNYENIQSNISSLSEACKKLRDLENYFLCTNNYDIASDISKILIKCESAIYNAKSKA